jgi:hypothetical protein
MQLEEIFFSIVMVVSFVILTVLYRLLEFLTLGAILQLRSQKKFKF